MDSFAQKGVCPFTYATFVKCYVLFSLGKGSFIMLQSLFSETLIKRHNH